MNINKCIVTNEYTYILNGEGHKLIRVWQQQQQEEKNYLRGNAKASWEDYISSEMWKWRIVDYV